MAYSNNNNHASIIRQSSLKAALEYLSLTGRNDAKLTEVIGISIAFSQYAEDGDYDIAQTVERKLEK
tara:strand:- start:399 stop:599 length:201 start_codon:yes stop_codon:yes gene_type:complete